MRLPLSRRSRFDALEKCGYRCVYCGRGPQDGVVLQVDHGLPVARGGENENENLVASCTDCNYGKRPAFPAHTFLGWLRVQVARDDIVGDLARDEERDRLIEPLSFKDLSKQIKRSIRGGLLPNLWGSRGGLSPNTWVPNNNPICAAWHAWREYRRGGKPTILVERLRERREKSEQEARERGGTAIWKPARFGGHVRISDRGR